MCPASQLPWLLVADFLDARDVAACRGVCAASCAVLPVSCTSPAARTALAATLLHACCAAAASEAAGHRAGRVAPRLSGEVVAKCQTIALGAVCVALALRTSFLLTSRTPSASALATALSTAATSAPAGVAALVRPLRLVELGDSIFIVHARRLAARVAAEDGAMTPPRELLPQPIFSTRALPFGGALYVDVVAVHGSLEEPRTLSMAQRVTWWQAAAPTLRRLAQDALQSRAQHAPARHAAHAQAIAHTRGDACVEDEWQTVRTGRAAAASRTGGSGTPRVTDAAATRPDTEVRVIRVLEPLPPTHHDGAAPAADSVCPVALAGWLLEYGALYDTTVLPPPSSLSPSPPLPLLPLPLPPPATTLAWARADARRCALDGVPLTLHRQQLTLPLPPCADFRVPAAEPCLTFAFSAPEAWATRCACAALALRMWECRWRVAARCSGLDIQASTAPFSQARIVF